ncbi:MAG: hypothetical protein U1F43_33220 [Myxococcota bacterium]
MLRRPLLLALALATLAPAAHAGRPRIEFGSGFGFGKSDKLGQVLGVTPEMTFTLPLTKRGAFVADWGFTWAGGDDRPPQDSSAIALEDPFIGLQLEVADDDFYLRFRPGFTLPLASFTDDANAQPAQTVAFNLAHGMFGQRNLWRYLPENASFVGTAEMGVGDDESGRWRFWLDAAVAFPTTKLDPDTDLIIDSGIGFAMGPFFVDMSFVWIPTNSGDNAQVAVRPGFEIELSSGATLEIAANVNLDGPFGSFDDGGVIGADARFRFTLGADGHSIEPRPEPAPVPEPEPQPEPEPDHPPAPTTPLPTDFDGVLQAVVRAFPGDYDAIKGEKHAKDGTLASIGDTWTSTVCLPGASECSVYQGFSPAANWYAVMVETTDEDEAEEVYDDMVSRIDGVTLPFTRVKLDDSREDALWSQSWLPFGPSDDYKDLVISVERMSNPVMKVGDHYEQGWSVIVRVNHQ